MMKRGGEKNATDGLNLRTRPWVLSSGSGLGRRAAYTVPLDSHTPQNRSLRAN